MSVLRVFTPDPEKPTNRIVVLLRTGDQLTFDTTNWRQRGEYLTIYREDQEPSQSDPFAVFPPKGWIGVVEQ